MDQDRVAKFLQNRNVIYILQVQFSLYVTYGRIRSGYMKWILK